MYSNLHITYTHVFVHSSFVLFKNLVLINRWNGPRYQRVLALCAFLTGVIPKGLILRKFCVRCCVRFVLCKFVSGLILWFMDNLWFVDSLINVLDSS